MRSPLVRDNSRLAEANDRRLRLPGLGNSLRTIRRAHEQTQLLGLLEEYLIDDDEFEVEVVWDAQVAGPNHASQNASLGGAVRMFLRASF
jgi:hypothetical protein